VWAAQPDRPAQAHFIDLVGAHLALALGDPQAALARQRRGDATDRRQQRAPFIRPQEPRSIRRTDRCVGRARTQQRLDRLRDRRVGGLVAALIVQRNSLRVRRIFL
jgi:hypothetical protein